MKPSAQQKRSGAMRKARGVVSEYRIRYSLLATNNITVFVLSLRHLLAYSQKHRRSGRPMLSGVDISISYRGF